MPKQKKIKTVQHAVEKTIQEYATSSTPHGIGYIFEPRSSSIAKCFWFIIVGLAVILSGLNTYKTYVDWKLDPTITVINTTSYPIENIEFPAITICSQGLAKGIMEKVVVLQFKRYLISKEIIVDDAPEANQTENSNNTNEKTFDMLSKEEVKPLSKSVICFVEN